MASSTTPSRSGVSFAVAFPGRRRPASAPPVLSSEQNGEGRGVPQHLPSARMLSREVFGGMTKETERPAEAPNARRRMRSHAHLMGQITPKM